MTHITLFSAPKPFTNPHIAVIQRNAITSWTKLPGVRVVLLGDEPGLAEIAQELGVTHVRDIPRSESGAPLMHAMFALARQHSDTPLYCVINADIILFEDFVRAAQALAAQRERFVMMGQRWDVDITEVVDFSEGWQERLHQQRSTRGVLHRPAGSDYFLFPAACYADIPAFVIGRAGWDNWMIYHARQQRFEAVDATPDVTIIHQNHDYSHLPGGKPHYTHPETEENIRLAGGRAATRFTLLDASKRLAQGRLRPVPMDALRLLRAVEAYPLLYWNNPALSERIWRYTLRLRNRLMKDA